MISFLAVALFWLGLDSVHAAPAAAPVSIYDGSTIVGQPTPYYRGILVLDRGRPTLAGQSFLNDSEKETFELLEKASGFYSSHFGRDSFDGKGSEIVAIVNLQKFDFLDLGGMRQNAAWVGSWGLFIFGAGGERLGNLGSALDVIAHEYTHAVVSFTSQLNYVGQSGALNEHLADVFGAMVQQEEEHPAEPFLIGEGTLSAELKAKYPALRDMLHPERSMPAQPTRMAEVPKELGSSCKPSGQNDNCGVHLLNGIPNRAIALSISQLGWERLRDPLYRVMTARLKSNSNFSDYRAKVLDEASKAGFSGAELDVVKAAFDEVGIR